MARATGTLCLFVLLAASTACTAPVYKAHAGEFAQEGRKAQASIEAVSKQASAAEKADQSYRIAHSSSCPMGATILLRNAGTGDVVTNAVKAFPRLASQCRSLARCEGAVSLTDTKCTQICFSPEEASCLASIGKVYKDSGNAVSPRDLDKFSAMMRNDDYDAIDKNEAYRLGASGFTALSAYVDFLEAASKPSIYDPKEEAKIAVEYATDAKGVAEAVKGPLKGWPSSDKIDGAANALTGVIALLQRMSADEADASKIKVEVASHRAEIDALIDQMRTFALSRAASAAASTSDVQANEFRRIDGEAREASGNPSVRARLLQERDSLASVDFPAAEEAIDSTFKALKAAHGDLVSLVQEPTDEHRKELAGASLQNLREAIASLVEIVALFT
jgi:hypothetical protein